MSIKFLGDNQLNQIQNSPNDSPWAKLIAQAEMLDRNKLRQPQGQVPQGTVASNIQQQLLNDQMQVYDKSRNADAAKAQLLAQLMGSGHIQGMAVGGSAIASPLNTPAPMMGPSPINPTKPEQTQTVPLGNSTLSVDDPNKKAKQHDIFQRLIDNSIIGAIQGKGSFGESLQLYSDMFSGKALQGLAEGGEIRGYEIGGMLNGRNYVGSQRKAPSFLDAIGGNLEPMFPMPASYTVPDQSQTASNDYSALEALRRKQRGESPTPPPELTIGAPFASLGNALQERASNFKRNISDMLPDMPSMPNLGSDNKGWHAPMQLPDERTATPGANPTITEQSKAPVKPPITKDNVVAVAKAHNYDKQQSQVLDAIQKEAALNQTQQAISKTAGEDSTESMYRQLKDADLDYAELAKRISENEKDLARERKDGTLTSIISGIGAALTEAGNYKQVGDRVFRPSAAGVIGAGVLGGLGTSEALEKEYRTGISKNLDALATLQSLKRQSRNDVMDAINAENQNKMMAQHYGALEDIAKQKLPGEMALTKAQADMYTQHAGVYGRAGAGATSGLAGERLATTQYNNLISKAQKQLDVLTKAGKMEGDPEYDAVVSQIAKYTTALGALTPAGDASQGEVPTPAVATALPAGVKVTKRP